MEYIIETGRKCYFVEILLGKKLKSGGQIKICALLRKKICALRGPMKPSVIFILRRS